jgi:hypothetical protein
MRGARWSKPHALSMLVQPHAARLFVEQMAEKKNEISIAPE